jgi:hypothetical protein
VDGEAKAANFSVWRVDSQNPAKSFAGSTTTETTSSEAVLATADTQT